MIHVVIYQNEKEECTGFQTEGHAEYADPGQDIVCAAASVLIINTMNAIELYTEDAFSVFSDEETGMISCAAGCDLRNTVVSKCTTNSIVVTSSLCSIT